MAKSEMKWIRIEKRDPEVGRIVRIETTDGDRVAARLTAFGQWVVINFDSYAPRSKVVAWQPMVEE
ncbi:MAG: hypothetical protein ACOWWM_09650 [Desulfobacterales bacterium]